MKKPETVEEYIAAFPEEIQQQLEKVRRTIRKAAPNAKEVISYAMPTYRLKRNLVHFAGYKNHIGFYPGPSGIAVCKDELAKYKGAKGSVQFPLNQPMPLDLIDKIVRFRVLEDS